MVVAVAHRGWAALDSRGWAGHVLVDQSRMKTPLVRLDCFGFDLEDVTNRARPVIDAVSAVRGGDVAGGV